MLIDPIRFQGIDSENYSKICKQIDETKINSQKFKAK